MEGNGDENDFVVEDGHVAVIALIVNNTSNMEVEWTMIMGFLLATCKDAAAKGRINRLIKQNLIYEAVHLTLTKWIATLGGQAWFNSLLRTIQCVNQGLRDTLNANRESIRSRGESIIRDEEVPHAVQEEMQTLKTEAGSRVQYATFERPRSRHGNINSWSRLSEMDITRKIDDSTWVVALARNSPVHRNDSHVFIVVEGLDGRRAKTYFIDFVAGRPIDLALRGPRPGKIRFQVQEGSLRDSLLYTCSLQLMELVPGEPVISHSCNLDRTLYGKLVEKVKRASEAAVQPQYNVFRNESVSPGNSTLSESRAVSHNCFSWAYQQLEELNDPQAMNGFRRFNVEIPNPYVSVDEDETSWIGKAVLCVTSLPMGMWATFQVWKENILRSKR